VEMAARSAPPSGPLRKSPEPFGPAATLFGPNAFGLPACRSGPARAACGGARCLGWVERGRWGCQVTGPVGHGGGARALQAVCSFEIRFTVHSSWFRVNDSWIRVHGGELKEECRGEAPGWSEV